MKIKSQFYGERMLQKIAKPMSLKRKVACKFTCRECGLVLVEVMISLSIGLLLISLLMGIYLACQQSLKLETALNNIQANAKDAAAILTMEVHQAGNIGCARLTNDFPITPYQQYQLNAENKIVGNAYSELTLRHAEYPNVFLTSSMQDNHKIITSKNIQFDPGEILLISSCERAEIFVSGEVKQRNGMQEITLISPLHHKYEKYAEVSRLLINKFYIAKTRRKYMDGSAIYALFVENSHHQNMELVAGVDQMEMKYTQQKAGRLQEVSAGEVGDWSQVLGVAMDFKLHAPPLKKSWHVYAALN